MSEPIIETPPVDDAAEIATLRRVNSELLAKSATRKAKIAELETALATTQGELTNAGSTIRELTIGGPLKAMAESISTAPELWMEQFAKTYKVEMVEGRLTVLTNDGKPLLSNGKPVAFERQALADFLTNEDHPQAKNFRSFVIVSRASGGGGGIAPRRTTTTTPKPKHSFGLR